mgnify:CR=1 FL=1
MKSSIFDADLVPLQALDVFDNEKMYIGLEDSYEFKKQASLPFANNTPIIFDVEATSHTWTSPEMYVDVGVKVWQEATTELEKKQTDLKDGFIPIKATDEMCLTMLPFHSLFSDVQVAVNDLNLVSRTGLYPFMAFFDRVHLTHEDQHLIDKTLELGDFDPEDWSKDINSTFGKRRRCIAEGRECFLRGRLNVSLLRQDKFLLPGVNVTITLHQTTPEFRIFSQLGKKLKVEITRAELIGRKVVSNPQLFQLTMEALKREPAKYSFLRMEPTIFQMANGTSTIDRQITLPNGAIPRTVFVMSFDSAGVYGSYKMMPFKTQLMDISEIYMQIEEKVFPPYRYQEPITKIEGRMKVFSDYKEVCRALNKDLRYNTINFDTFKTYPAIAFNLDRLGALHRQEREVQTLPRTGVATLHIKLKDPLINAMTFIVICTYQNCVTFNEALLPQTDYIN